MADGTDVEAVESAGVESLGSKGSALWEGYVARCAGDPGLSLLLLEACRTADRLEKLDRLLRGDRPMWMSLALPGGDVEVRIDAVLSEARQQGAALARLLDRLPPAPPSGEGDGLWS